MRLRGRLASTFAVLLSLAAGEASGQYFGQNKIAYRTFDWKIYHSPHFDVYYYTEAEPSLEKVVSFAESAYDVLSREFDFQVKEPTPLIYFATHSAFEQTNVIQNFIPEGVGAFAVSARRRMVMPVDLPDKELLELIAHELTHVFQYHILYQGRLRAPIGQSPPKWLMEGMASYMAEDEGPRERMFLRDAVVNDQVPPITQAPDQGFFSYRFGHAVFDFMEARWGKDGFRDFVYEYRNAFGSKVDKAVERAFRTDAEDFDIEFRRWLRRKYLPELVRTGEPSDFGRPFVKAGEEPAYQISPVASPSGDLVAAFSTLGGEVNVVLFDARKREVIRKLTNGQTHDYRYLVAQELELGRKMGHDLAFSPDGNTVAVFAKRESGRALVLLDALRGGIRRIVDLDAVEQQVGLSWSPDGRRIAFSGHQAGKFDIFEVTLETGEVKNLTQDEPFDGSPAYSPDGGSIVYTSIAAEHGKLIQLSLTDGSRQPLTDGEGTERDSVFSRDGKLLYFASDRTGIENIYSRDMASGEIRQITNVVTGCFMPAPLLQADGSERVVFSGYWKGRFDLYLVDDIEEVSERLQETLAATSEVGPALAEILQRGQTMEPEAPADEALQAARFEPDIRVTIDDANKDTYGKFRLFIEDVGVQVGVNSDQTFVSDSYIAMTDTLGDRRLFLQFSSIDTFSNFDISYFNLKSRWQWGVRLFDERTYYYTQDSRTGEIERGQSLYKETGLMASTIYPFSIYRRMEFGLGYKYRKIDYQAFEQSPDGTIVPIVLPRADDFPELQVGMVVDSTVFSSFGPLSGRRYRLSASYAPDFDQEDTLHLDGEITGTLTASLSLDFRQYIQVSRRSNIALRLFGAASQGNFPSPVYFGGLDTLRGFEFRELVGDHAFFVNLEYRFPVFDYLIGPFLNFRGIRGRFFLDVGGAWFETAGEDFDFWESDESRLDDALSSYGFGFTLNFSGLDLNWDFAKRWDFKESIGDGFETSFWIGTQF